MVAADVAGGRIEMVLVAEGQQVPAPAADRSQPARHLVELVDVERDVEDPVLERVGEGPDPPMSDDAFEEVGLHAARSCSAVWSASAASQPERHPSSWKP